MGTIEEPGTPFGAPEALILKLKNAERVVLVASNPNINREHIRQAQINSRCLVFSFNKCRQLLKLPLNTNHCFVHRYGIKNQKFYGYPHKIRIRLFEKFARTSEAFLLGFDFDSPNTEGIENAHFIPMVRDLSLLKNYPFESLPDRGGASTGFYLIALLKDLREVLNLSFTITLIGFTDNGGGRQWSGHAWDFERRMTAELKPDMIQVFPKKTP